MALEDQVTLFVNYSQTFKRAPYHVGNAFEAATKAPPTSIQRVLADAGEPAFRAWYAAKTNASSTHRRKIHRQLRTAFHNLSKEPVDGQRAFAQLLAKSMQGVAPGPVETGEGNSSRKRPATDDDARYASSTTPTLNDSTHSEIPGGAVQPVETGEDNRSGRRRCTERSIRNAFPYTIPDGARTNHAAHNSGPSADGVHDAASLKGAKTVFKAEVMDSITRRQRVRDAWTTEWVADITLFLQKSEVRNRFGCQMDIGIAKEKVAYYAKKLCEVDIEIIDELRYIRYPNGSKIEPDPSIKLRAIRPDAILEIFGKEIFDGFSSAPIRRHEQEQARDRTDGASMTISNRDRESGKITLYIGDYHAFRLRDALYPPRDMETLTGE